MGLPCECPFPSPPSRYDAKTGRGQILGPVDLVRRNVLGHPDLLVARPMLDELGTPAQRRLDPVLAFAAPIVPGIQPDMRAARERGGNRVGQQELDPIAVPAAAEGEPEG